MREKLRDRGRENPRGGARDGERREGERRDGSADGRAVAPLAGFGTRDPDTAVPELLEVGEQWAATSAFVSSQARPAWQFYLQVDGSTVWDVGGQVYALRQGHFLAVPPRVVHALRHRARVKHHFFFASIDLRPIMARQSSLRGVWTRSACVYFRNGESLIMPFRQLVREISMRMTYRAEGLRAALDYLVIQATRLFQQAGSNALLPSHPAVQQVKEILETRCEQQWLLADLGRVVGLSPNHFVELFTREVGVSPHKYLIRQRIERAKDLLRSTDEPVNDLAERLGFASSQHFAKIFRQSTRSTALAFRRRYRGKA